VTSLKEFRNEIIIYGIVMAAVAEVVSLFVIGPDALFSAGLAAGTAVSVIGFIILVKTGETLSEKSKKSPILLGYIVRLLLYGVVFFIFIKASLPCGFGCVIGFVTIHFGILFLYGVVYKFFKKKKNPLNDWTEPKEWNDLSVYDDEDDDWPKPEDRIGSPEYEAAHSSGKETEEESN
jgi:hypothetical protein